VRSGPGEARTILLFHTISARPPWYEERPQSTGSKIMFSLFFYIKKNAGIHSGFLHFFNLYDKSRPENQTKRGEIDLFRTISKVLVYVFCSKRIDFRAILRNTLGTLVDWGLSLRTFLKVHTRPRLGMSLPRGTPRPIVYSPCASGTHVPVHQSPEIANS
jgi:hypothetical protein